MMSAPARLIAVRCSRATAAPSIQPRSAAALIIAYSPDTWYAASGHVDLGAGPAAMHVEVGERGLHHHHVGALGDVGPDLLQRLADVARVLLVGPAVAAAGDLDVDRLAERAVERRGVLGRVGEDRHRRRGRSSSSAARMARTWPSIIPDGRDDVGAGVGLGDGDLGVALEGGVVVDLAARR